MDLFYYFYSSITVVLVLILCFFYLLRNSRQLNSKILPPEAAGAWPVIGHLPLLTRGELPHMVLGAMADKYGSIYSIRLGMQSAVVVSSSEIAMELFTTKDKDISSRPKLTVVKIMGYNSAMFAFAPSGPYWREVRKMVTSELLSVHQIELQEHIRHSEVTAFLKELHNVWSDNRSKGGSGHVMVDMKKWFDDLAMNIILRIVVGKSSFGAGAEGDEEEAKQCQKVIREVMRLFGLFPIRDALPFLGWLDLGGHEKAMRKNAKLWDNLFSQWLEEHKRKGAKEDKDFMDVMLSRLEGTNSIEGFDANVINKATCLNMISGGSQSLSTCMTWAISLLLNNRDALEKVREELDINVGKGRLVQESDITNLVYLEAVVKETFRLYPPAPLGGPREVIEDCSIGGYHVPKGTRVTLNVWKIQTDSKVWFEPFKFKPERFIEERKHVDFKGHGHELIPFGGGRRGCPGVAFSMQVLPFALASFIHAFDFSTPSDALVDMSGSLGITYAKVTPLELNISPRFSAAIYATY